MVNLFLEAGLPFIMRFVEDWRAGKAHLSDLKKVAEPHEAREAPPSSEAAAEKQFLDKVERELALPEYSLFSTSL